MSAPVTASHAIRDAAQRLIDVYGFEGARRENAKWRDQNSWGTFSHSWHVQVGKEIDRLKSEAEA